MIGAPARGIINVHASLLPKYRGAAPVAYAILGAEARTGVSIIKVTPGLDSGDVLLQEAVDILPDDTTGTLEARLAVLGARMAVDATRLYAAGGPVEGTKQDPAGVTKAPKIKKEFGLIDWSKPAEYIERFVRAMQPWPTAYTFYHRPAVPSLGLTGKEPMRVIVSRVERFGKNPMPERPCGTPYGDATEPGRLLVSVGNDEFISILELQPAGKKKMTSEEFLRGYPLGGLNRFGPEVLS